MPWLAVVLIAALAAYPLSYGALIWKDAHHGTIPNWCWEPYAPLTQLAIAGENAKGGTIAVWAWYYVDWCSGRFYPSPLLNEHMEEVLK